MGLFDGAAAISPLGGAGPLGLLGPLGKQMNEREGGRNAGNAYGLTNDNLSMLRDVAVKGSDANTKAAQAVATTSAGSDQVNNDSILSGLYGGAGTGSILQDTIGQEKDLAGRGFSLQPQDIEAYGQASGNIARMFGQNDQSLSQALSDRGLSNSGAAGQAFSSSLGNKNEQLAGLQTQIAQRRMEMNQQRLAQTQQFLNQMGVGAQAAIGGERAQNQAAYGAEQERSHNASKILGLSQGQENEKLSQEQQTSHPNDFITGLSGALAIGGTAAKFMGGSGGGSMSRGSERMS